MPDLALVLAAVTLVYTLFMFDGWHNLFRDSDTGWHIRTGEHILVSRTLPRTDPYSFTRAGHPWLDWEWAADAATGAAHRFGGLPAVAILFASAIALCSWIWVRLSWAAGGDFLLTALLSLPMLSTVNMHWLARPHVFGWVLLLAWLWWLEARRSSLLAAGVLGAVWANVHASFFLAPLTAVLYWAGSRQRAHLLCGAAAAAGSLCNPYGIALHRHVAAYLSDDALLSRIGEFQSFNFHAPGAGWVTVTFLVAVLGAGAAFANRRFDHFLVILFFAAVALRSARGLPVLALAALPLANANFAALWKGRRAYSNRLREIDRALGGWVWVPAILAIVLLPGRRADAGFDRTSFPVDAARLVAQLPREARILAPDKFGGYLIYRFDGARAVYFDGRSDFYGAEFMKEYLRLIEARPGWRDIARKYGFTHALVAPDTAIAAALGEAGWKRVDRDSNGETAAVLLAAPGEAHGS